MTAPITTHPDALVLGVGGTLGVAWLRGILAGLRAEAGIDFTRCEDFVGTSAGSIMAAALASGHEPDMGSTAAPPGPLDDIPAPAEGRPLLRAASRWAGALAAPVTPALLRLGTPGGALVRRSALRAGPRPTRRFDGLPRFLDGLGARFDGRLRICAVDAETGRRVVFGAPGAPQASVRDAVLASCAIPWFIEPVRIGGRDYVDGGLWSPTNLDVVPASRDKQVLCFVPTASLAAARSAFGAYRGLTMAATQAEALALKARGAHTRVVRPDRASAQAMGVNLMDSRRRATVMQAGFSQGRRLTLARSAA